MIDAEEPDGPHVRVGDPGPRAIHLYFSEPTRPFSEDGDDPVLDFLMRARVSG